MADILVFYDAFKLDVPAWLSKGKSRKVPLKTLLIEILIKECSVTQIETKVAELTLFPTEKDLWPWEPFPNMKSIQATYNDLKEMQLFEIDRLLKIEAKEAEKVIQEEIEAIEP